MSAPEWLRPLIRATRSLTAEELSRFTPPEEGGRQSAVLMLFGESSGEPDILLLQRSADMRSHAGQPAFPGGALDPEDAGPVAAALREAHEETGVDPAGVEVLQTLPQLWLPPSGFVVTPVLAWWQTPSPVHAKAPAEVQSVHRVPITDLTEPAHRVRVRHPSGFVGPGFEVCDMLVWGFTAMLLDRILDLGGWKRPWEPGRVVEVGWGG